MTYCVGLRLKKGLVFMSDTCTNAGVDDIARVRKIHSWEVPGERVITVLSAGNLATTQAVISLVDERSKAPEERNPSILKAPSMFQVASIIGNTLRDVVKHFEPAGPAAESVFGATLILGGQIRGSEQRLFLIYPEGNFIESGDDTLFFQSGETKYGRPILIRALHADMDFQEAVKLLCVSFDSTIRANLSVDLPIDLQVQAVDDCRITHEHRFENDDTYFKDVSRAWSEALRAALNDLPDFRF